MTSQNLPKTDSQNPSAKKIQEDIAGRDKLVSNVIFNWLAYLVYIAAGFVMPRLIDQKLGPDILGVWDFAWSLTAYFNLVQFGISSSINRYIAKYRAAGDISGINQIVNTSGFLLGIAGLIVFIFTITLSILLPVFFSVKLKENTGQAQWVLFFIGSGLAFQMAFSPFNGLITGFHKWGLHNFIRSGWYLVIVAGMIVSLLLGGDLRSIAIVTFIGQVLESITRMILAYHICKGLHISPSFISKHTIKKQFVFGGKTLIPSLSNLLLNQTTSILILAYLSPAALALYSRPRSLVNHINTLVSKMAMTLVPTISSLQSSNNYKEIRELLISSVRYSLYLVLPIVVVLVVFGDTIMEIWMGSDYANGLLVSILVIGYVAYIVQMPALNILGGLNSHGHAGIAQLIASIISVGLTFLVLGYFKLGIVGAAVAVTLPLAIMNLFYIPVLVCRKIKLEIKRYFFSVITKPLIYVSPLAICLLVNRLIFKDNLVNGLIGGCLTGFIILIVIYWHSVLPKRIKNRLSFTKSNQSNKQS